MKKEKLKPNWTLEYIKKVSKEDFVKNHSNIFEGVTDKDLEETWISFNTKQKLISN